MVLDTTILLESFPGDKIIGVVFHNFGKVDVDDIDNLSKSAAYDMRPQEIVVVPWSQSFTEEVHKGAHGTSYLAIIVPPTVGSGSFKTIREALALGGKIVGAAGGPP